MTLVAWLLIGLVAWSLLAIVLGPVIGRAIRGPRHFDPQDRERVGLDSDRERWDAICEQAEYERRRRQSHRQRRKAA